MLPFLPLFVVLALLLSMLLPAARLAGALAFLKQVVGHPAAAHAIRTRARLLHQSLLAAGPPARQVSAS